MREKDYFDYREAALKVIKYVDTTTNPFPKGITDLMLYRNLQFEDIVALFEKRIIRICDYTGERVEEVVEKICGYQNNGGKEWSKYGRHPLIFHSKVSRLMYAWVGIMDYLALMRELTIDRINSDSGMIGVKILDFAGGNGEVGIQLARRGCDVTYADIGLKTMDFVKWRCCREAINLRFAPVVNGEVFLDNNKGYDYIICFNALSHFPDAKDYLNRFYKWLVDDGELIIADDIQISPTYPDGRPLWHLMANKKYTTKEGHKFLFKDWMWVKKIYANCDVWRKII